MGIGRSDGQIFFSSITPAILFFFVADFILPSIFFKSLGEFVRRDFITIKDTDIIVLGDSHTQYAVDPSLCVEWHLRCANMSASEQYFEFSIAYYELYKRRFGLPKAVIQSLPIFAFTRESNLRRIAFLLTRDEFSEYFTQRSLDGEVYFYNWLNGKPNLMVYGPLIGSGLFIDLVKSLFNSNTEILDIGYGLNYVRGFKSPIPRDMRLVEPNDAMVLDYLKDGFSSTTYKNKKNLELLHQFLSLVNTDKVPIFLVETPEFQGTREYLRGRDNFYREVNLAISRYQSVRFFAADKFGSIDPRNPELFVDGGFGTTNSHLNFYGSQKFSKELFKKVLN